MLKKEYVSKWSLYLNDFNSTPKEVYALIEQNLKSEEIPNVKTDRKNFSEKGMFSNKREYLKISGRGHYFYVCVAPFGKGFFVSYWLLEDLSSKKSLLARIPILGQLIETAFTRETFYTMDTRSMFLSAVHHIITETINVLLKEKGQRQLTELEAKIPAME